MPNPYYDTLDDSLRGRKVRATSELTDATYYGWVDRIHHTERDVILRDVAVDCPEDGLSTHDVSVVSSVDDIRTITHTTSIDSVAPDEVRDSPYHTREFSESENRGYIDDVRDTGFVGSYPAVRPIVPGDSDLGEGTEYEVVEGHKRLWACRQAGISSHPVVVETMDGWTATRRFVADHYPGPGGVHDDTGYDDAELGASIKAVLERWGDRAFDLDRVRFNFERLGLEEWLADQFEVPATTADVAMDDFTVFDDGVSRPEAPEWADGSSGGESDGE